MRNPKGHGAITCGRSAFERVCAEHGLTQADVRVRQHELGLRVQPRNVVAALALSVLASAA
jgi:hypothetical protein